ncbi:MAG: TonB-dependent receptor [Gemmatimonadales bacterium]
MSHWFDHLASGLKLPSNVRRLALVVACHTAFLVSALSAQAPATGAVLLSVEEAMGPVAEALIRVGALVVTTDAAGRARLTLPAGRQALTIARIGYLPKRVSVLVLRDAEVRVTVTLEMEMVMTEVDEITVSAARTERLAGETPIRVEVITPEEVDEKTQMSPSGVTMLLNETPGVRVQSTSPSLGTGAVRILGLPGQYTAMLADGLPLYGGASSSIGPLDISPVDLLRVEVIKGAASALYGGQALGGVVNLVSKPPTGRSEFLVNRRTLGVTDGAAWLSRRFGPTLGGSFLISGTSQAREDVDRDGWGDQARAERWGVRPRLNFVDSTGRTLFVTVGHGYDARTGGTMPGAVAPDGLPFREALTSRRADIGVSGKLPTGHGGNMALRLALSTAGRQRTFGPGAREDDRISTGFVELTRSTVDARTAVVLGAALQGDGYHNELNAAFDHTWWTPGLFVTAERDVGPVTLSASVRGDLHPQAGSRVTERLALLVRPAEAWSLRLSGGTGYAPATAQLEETDAIGLRRIRPAPQLTFERSTGATVDLGGRVGGVELLITGYGAEIRKGVQLADAGDGSSDGVLVNSAGPTRIGGGEFLAIRRFRGGKLLVNYGVTWATRTDAATGAREDVPLLPRHRAGVDLMLERPGVYRIGVEAMVYGVQMLDEDPYLARSKPYVYAMFLVMRQFGRLEVVANFENLLNVRQTDFAPLVRPTPMTGGRWTVDAWAPLEGFMANVAVRYRW